MVLSIALKRQLSVLLSALLASCLVVAEDNKNNPLRSRCLLAASGLLAATGLAVATVV